MSAETQRERPKRGEQGGTGVPSAVFLSQDRDRDIGKLGNQLAKPLSGKPGARKSPRAWLEGPPDLRTQSSSSSAHGKGPGQGKAGQMGGRGRQRDTPSPQDTAECVGDPGRAGPERGVPQLTSLSAPAPGRQGRCQASPVIPEPGTRRVALKFLRGWQGTWACEARGPGEPLNLNLSFLLSSPGGSPCRRPHQAVGGVPYKPKSGAGRIVAAQ